MNSVQHATNLWEFVERLDPDARVGVILCSFFAVVLTITIVAVTIYKMHKNRLDDALKRELLDRGMSADEIAKVVSSKPEARETE